MRSSVFTLLPLAFAATVATNLPAAAQDLDGLKDEVLDMIDARSKQVQEIVDMQFSFGELGMQEFETQRYLTGILEENGFEIELGVAGMPSAWTARWSNGTGRGPELTRSGDHHR